MPDAFAEALEIARAEDSATTPPAPEPEPTTTTEANDDAPVTPSQPETETDTTPAPETPETPEGEPEGNEEEEDNGDLLSYIRDTHGEDLSSLYQTPEAAIKGLLASHRLVGKRDEDASYGKGMRELLKGREEQLAAFIQGDTPQKPSENGKPKQRELEDFPEDADTWRFQIVQDETTGKLKPVDGAPPNVVEDYREYQSALARRMTEMARDWKKIKELPDQIKTRFTEAQNQTKEQRENAALTEWENQYKDALYVGGDKNKLTPEGNRTAAKYNTLLEKGMSRIDAFQTATEIVFGSPQLKTKTPSKPGTKAMRTTGVATKTAKTYASVDEELESRISAGEDLAKILTEIGKREQGVIG